MAITCEECLKLISRQIDRAASEAETHSVRTHTLHCEECRAKFNSIMRADSLVSKAMLSLRLSDGFSAVVAEKLASADLAESAKGSPKTLFGVAGLLGVVIVVLLVLLGARSGPDIPSIGEMGRVETEVELALYESDSFSSASLGMEIPRGAKARTGIGSGVLRLSGGADVAIGTETAVDLAHYHDGRKILLDSGEVYVIAPESGFQIDTLEAKVYAKKAEFLVSRRNAGKTTLVVKSGSANLLGPGGAVIVGPGRRAEILEGKKPKKPIEADMDDYLGWVRQLGL
jgi:hypothetical protein